MNTKELVLNHKTYLFSVLFLLKVGDHLENCGICVFGYLLQLIVAKLKLSELRMKQWTEKLEISLRTIDISTSIKPKYLMYKCLMFQQVSFFVNWTRYKDKKKCFAILFTILDQERYIIFNLKCLK